LFSGPELNNALFSGSAHIFNNIKAADRICKICKDGVEDEIHFLVKGKNFENIRKPYLETIYTLYPNLFFFRTTRVIKNNFFLSRKALIFFPEFNIRLYNKNSESDYFFFPPPKSEYFFQQHWESEYFFPIVSTN
jgi:hypothetical protein